MFSISNPIAFVIIFVVFSQRTLSNQYQEASLPTNNKSQQHVVKTIRNEFGGDIYDCVDIYKQPSLSHPLLKNHKIQMRPNFKPLGNKLRKSTTSNAYKHLNIIKQGLKNECPRGTVPIRRSSTQPEEKEDFITSGTLQSDFNEKFVSTASYFAGVKTKDFSTKKYYTVSTIVSVYTPTVKQDQMSGVVISLQSGGDAAFMNRVEAGWMVNPELYGDTNTRLYTRWTADNGYTTGCYNIKCPGFIQVSTEIPVDFILNDTTINKEHMVQVGLQIIQEKTQGNWWFVFGLNHVNIGYWPKEIVPDLVNGGHAVKVGGIVASPTVDSKPPMGSGFAFGKKWSYYNSAFFAQVRLVDEVGVPFPADNRFLDIIMKQCYQVADNSYKDYPIDRFDYIFGYSFVFGGQGGSEFDCQPWLAR